MSSSSRAPSPPANRSAFHVAIIAALGQEADAAHALFDQFYEEDDRSFRKAAGDPNSYKLGRIGDHYVVLVRTPGMAKVNTANTAASCRSSFPNIRLGLVVGICGGVPELPTDGDDKIFLGDVIISTYVVQSDFGRQYADRIVTKNTLEDSLPRHGDELTNYLNSLQGAQTKFNMRRLMAAAENDMKKKEWFEMPNKPDVETDYFYEDTYRHKHRYTHCNVCKACVGPEDPVCLRATESTCGELECEASHRTVRTRPQNSPQILFGRIASTDQVMKSSFHRDRIAREQGVLAFEMEGAGAWNNFPTIVVKSVCDYADSHKNKAWQKYAAVVAASAAKAMLREWRAVDSNTDTETGRTQASAPVSAPAQIVAPPPSVHNDFRGGNFLAGRNQHMGGTYTSSGPMTFN